MKITPKSTGAWSCLKRLSTNYLFLFHIFSSVFRLIGYLGYYIMKPKYIMLQYRQSASSASFFTGATSVGTMAFGTMTGGVFIKFFKPKPRTLASLILFVELFSAIGIFSSMFISCPTPQFSSLPKYKKVFLFYLNIYFLLLVNLVPAVQTVTVRQKSTHPFVQLTASQITFRSVTPVAAVTRVIR